MTDLWTFMLHSYAKTGVKDLCLSLQNDCGLDVLLLLSDVFLHRRWPATADLQPYLAWRTEVIVPLRSARMALVKDDPLRAEFLQLELKAEQQGVRLLAQAFAQAREFVPLEISQQSVAFIDGQLRPQAQVLPLHQQLLAALL